MLPPLADRTPEARRLVLAMYANAHYPYGNARWTPIMRALRDKDWSPTPDDCPVEWQTLAAWYGEVPDRPQRKGRKRHGETHTTSNRKDDSDDHP